MAEQAVHQSKKHFSPNQNRIPQTEGSKIGTPVATNSDPHLSDAHKASQENTDTFQIQNKTHQHYANTTKSTIKAIDSDATSDTQKSMLRSKKDDILAARDSALQQMDRVFFSPDNQLQEKANTL